MPTRNELKELAKPNGVYRWIMKYWCRSSSFCAQKLEPRQEFGKMTRILKKKGRSHC